MTMNNPTLNIVVVVLFLAVIFGVVLVMSKGSNISIVNKNSNTNESVNVGGTGAQSASGADSAPQYQYTQYWIDRLLKK